MSARDDYPYVGVYREQWNTMCDEIDRQRAKVDRLDAEIERLTAEQRAYEQVTLPDDIYWDLDEDTKEWWLDNGPFYRPSVPGRSDG